MNINQEKENSDKYHQVIYKWALESSPKPPNYRNIIDFKDIWKFTRIGKIIRKESFSFIVVFKTCYCHC